MMVMFLFLISSSIMLFGTISGRVEKSIFTAPLIYTMFGLIIHLIIHPQNLTQIPMLDTLGTVTLILLLFTDAARIDLQVLKREYKLTLNLLMGGIPLTLMFGAILAKLIFPDFSWWMAAMLAALLTPTDAALSQTVVSSKLVPVHLRQTLNAESGLNDGVMLPVILLLISFAPGLPQSISVASWIKFAMLQLLVGPGVGIMVGFLGGKLVVNLSKSGWMSHTFQDLSSLGLSMLAYSVAEYCGGNGFLSAFVAGLTLGNSSRQICTCLYEFAEAEGQLLTLIIFMIFGTYLLPVSLKSVNLPILLFSLASLTIMRMVPVFLVTKRLKLKTEEKLFLGWFGPRGIASLLFALLVLEKAGISVGNKLLPVVYVTVFLSIILHGITAYPWAKHISKKTNPNYSTKFNIKELPERIPMHQDE